MVWPDVRLDHQTRPIHDTSERYVEDQSDDCGFQNPEL